MAVDVDGTAQLLVGQIEAVESELNAELRRVLNDPRWQYRVGRIRNLLAETEAAKDDIIRAGAEWVNGPFRDAYAQAAADGAARLGAEFAWTQFHREAFTMLGTDTFDDVLDATRFMGDDVKQLIRRVGQARAAGGEIAGRTALQSAELMRKDLLERGLTAVIYKNGAKYGVGTFSRMLMRTKTALARNLGSMVQYREMGVQYVEIVDGQDCGLGSHFDTQKADGLVLPLNEAAGYPLSHPNCVRDFLPRPDIARPEEVSTAEGLVEESRWEDQRRFERYLERERITREGRIQARTPRSHRTERVPRSKRLPRETLSRRNLRGRTPTPEELLDLDLDLDFERTRGVIVDEGRFAFRGSKPGPGPVGGIDPVEKLFARSRKTAEPGISRGAYWKPPDDAVRRRIDRLPDGPEKVAAQRQMHLDTFDGWKDVEIAVEGLDVAEDLAIRESIEKVVMEGVNEYAPEFRAPKITFEEIGSGGGSYRDFGIRVGGGEIKLDASLIRAVERATDESEFLTRLEEIRQIVLHENAHHADLHLNIRSAGHLERKLAAQSRWADEFAETIESFWANDAPSSQEQTDLWYLRLWFDTNKRGADNVLRKSGYDLTDNGRAQELIAEHFRYRVVGRPIPGSDIVDDLFRQTFDDLDFFPPQFIDDVIEEIEGAGPQPGGSRQRITRYYDDDANVVPTPNEAHLAILEELDVVPDEVFDLLEERGASIQIGSGRGMGTFDPSLAGVRPRGWPSGTWDDVAGMYDPSTKTARVTSRGRSGSLSSIRHEVGHAVDDAFRGTTERVEVRRITEFRKDDAKRRAVTRRGAELLEDETVDRATRNERAELLSDLLDKHEGEDGRFYFVKAIDGVVEVDVPSPMASELPEWREVHKRARKAGGDDFPRYYRQRGDAGPEEFFAEGFAHWGNWRSGGEISSARRLRLLGVDDAALYDDVMGAFDDLFERRLGLARREIVEARPGDRFRGTGTWLDDIADDYDIVQTSDRSTWYETVNQGGFVKPGDELVKVQEATERIGAKVNAEVERRLTTALGLTSDEAAALRATVDEAGPKIERLKDDIEQKLGRRRSIRSMRDKLAKAEFTDAADWEDVADVITGGDSSAWSEVLRRNRELLEGFPSQARLLDMIDETLADLKRVATESRSEIRSVEKAAEAAKARLAGKAAAETAEEAADRALGLKRQEFLEARRVSISIEDFLADTIDNVHEARPPALSNDQWWTDRLNKRWTKGSDFERVMTENGYTKESLKRLGFDEGGDQIRRISLSLVDDLDDLKDDVRRLSAAAEAVPLGELPVRARVQVEVLSEIREMGGTIRVEVEATGYRGVGSAARVREVEEMVDFTGQILPKDWIDGLNARGATTARQIRETTDEAFDRMVANITLDELRPVLDEWEISHPYDVPEHQRKLFLQALDKANPDSPQQWRAGVRTVEGREGGVTIVNRKARAHASDHENLVNIGISTERETMAHEMMHLVDGQSEGGAMAWAKLTRRFEEAADRPPQSPMVSDSTLRKIRDEVVPESQAYADGGFAGSYTGRVYHNQGPNQYAWEVHSTGVEGYFGSDALRTKWFGGGVRTNPKTWVDEVVPPDQDFLDYIAGLLAVL